MDFKNLNPFRKKDPKEKERVEKLMKEMPGAKDLNMFQKFALKRVLSLPPEERAKVMQKAMKPENIAKHKDEILKELDAMKKAGMMSDDQYRLARRRLSL